MLLISHIIIAIISMVYTTYLLFSPSRPKLRASYALVIATLASGTYLVVSTGSPVLKSCLSGLVYLGLVSAGIIIARHKLNLKSQQTSAS